ncbi:MAG: carotenoid oxygenase family protein [Haloarculaceae archaeon]
MDGHDGRALAFGDVTEELSVELDVEGEVPGWLDGALVRNGPGRFSFPDTSVDHWFDGLAMLRKFAVRDGRVVYRNRFLDTEAYRNARRGRYEGGFGTESTRGAARQVLGLLIGERGTDNTNVNVWRYAGEYVALTETPNLTTFDPETLATTGRTGYLGDPEGQHVTGHPHHDRERGETVGFSTRFGREPAYRLWRQPDDRWGRETIGTVRADEPAYMHSFGLTDRYVVLTEFPLVASPLDLLRPGAASFIERFDWRPARGTRIHVLDRASGGRVARPTAAPCYGFHHVNAYDDGDVIVADLVTFPDADAVSSLYFEDLADPDGDWSFDGGRLTRYRIDPAAGTVDEREIHGGHVGLPRISPDVYRRRHRYVYGQGERGQPVTELPGEVLKIDVETGGATAYRREDAFVSEPVFVPRPDGDREDDGVVFAVFLVPDAERSELVVLDGRSMDELARAPLPHALPLDFHGQWLPEVGDPAL